MIFKVLVTTVLTNLFKMLVTEKMIIWGLKQFSKMTDNKIDDNTVGIIEAGFNSDPEGLKTSTEALLAELKSGSKDGF